MERINGFKWSSLLVALVVAGSLGADAPATQPAPANDVQTNNRNDRERNNWRRRGNRNEPVKNISATDPYAILRTRSIFVKGNQAIAGDVVPAQSSSLTATGQLVNRPEASLVFNGVINVNDETNAMIEDMGSSKVILVRTGDLIAVGKVSAITFDDLTYEASGKVNHVSIGEALDGSIPSAGSFVASTTQPSGADGGSPPSPAAAGGPPAGSNSGLSAEDILARMRAKRNAELGIK